MPYSLILLQSKPNIFNPMNNHLSYISKGCSVLTFSRNSLAIDSFTNK